MNEYGNDLQYQGDGETYMDEWAARGHTESGEEVRVYWHFEIAREGAEKEGAYANDTETENYDWDDPRSVSGNGEAMDEFGNIIKDFDPPSIYRKFLVGRRFHERAHNTKQK